MDEETISPEQVSCSREIGDDPAELAAVAAEVVAGKPIVNARIKNLRALIEAVQQHPGAKLAPPSEERDEKWRPLYSGSEDVLTTLEITGGEILEADCDSLDCRIGLVISASFADYARFSQASFADAAWFEGARRGLARRGLRRRGLGARRGSRRRALQARRGSTRQSLRAGRGSKRRSL